MGCCKFFLPILVLLIAGGVGYYLNWEHTVSNGIKVPGAPVEFPFGNVLVLFSTPNFLTGLETLTKHYADQITGLASIWQLDTQAISISHHQDVEKVLGTTTYRENPSRIQSLMEYIVGKTALISLNGAEWEKYRKIVYGAVAATDFNKVVPDLVAAADTTADYFVQSGRELDAAPFMRNLALYIIGQNVYNRPLTGVNNGTQAAVTVMINELIRRTSGANPIDTLYFIPTEENKALNHAKKIFHDDIKDEIAKRKARFEGVDLKHEDFLKHLLEGKELNDDELVDAVGSMVFGSTETYTAFFSTAIYVIGTRPDIQSKVAAEAKKAFADLSKFNYDDLKYTNLVVKEVLRLYPPTPLTQRTLSAIAKLGQEGKESVTVPKGTGIWIPGWVIHRSPSNFPDQPLEFKPERFLEPIPEYAYIPFSGGKRNCAATAFAEKVLTVVFGRLVAKAEYTTAGPKEIPSTSNGFTEWPAEGVPIVTKARTN